MRWPHSLPLRVAGRTACRALVLLAPLVACPGTARSEFWKEKDWKDGDHKLTVCVKTAGCPASFADSVKAAVDLWNAMNLTWVFEWKGTDCSGTPDIVIGCKNLPIGQLGVAKSRYIPGTATVDHVDILIKSNALWGWCGEMFEIVSVIAHELGHAMRLKDVSKTKQHRCMRCEQLSAGHSRKPSPEDSTEAVASDTARAITTKIIPPDKEKQSGASGTIVPAPGTWPFDFPRALNIQLRPFNAANFQILNYQPVGPNTLSWQGLVTATTASMELVHLEITYPESVSVREALLYVTDVPFQPGWMPHAVAPPDTMVPYDTDDIILYPYLSSHPAGDVTAFRWIVDDAFDVEGAVGEVSVTLPAGSHQVILVAEDQAGRQDRDTMQVVVLANVGVPEVPESESLRLTVQVPFHARGAASLPIRYELPMAGDVTLTLYDMQGRAVRVLLRNESAPAGPHRAAWDLRNEAGLPVPAGTYVCALRSRGVTVGRKLLIVR